jgi:hypothetical protein
LASPYNNPTCYGRIIAYVRPNNKCEGRTAEMDKLKMTGRRQNENGK